MIHNFLWKCKDIFIDSINKLKGSDRRIAIAKVSNAIGKGGQRIVAKEFNVSRDTIRKFSRNGKCRYAVEAADHDFGSKFITPFGILDLADNTVELKFTESKVTADFMVDAIQDFWIKNLYQLDMPLA